MSVGIKRIREEPDIIRQGAVDKGEDSTLIDIALALDTKLRSLTEEANSFRALRNSISKEINKLKA